MTQDSQPILIVPAIPFNGGIRFLHYESQIDLEEEDSKEVWQFLACCDGRNSLEIIAKIIGKNVDEVLELAESLYDIDVIVDSREQFMHFHKISNYPTFFSYNLTQEEVQAQLNSPRKKVKTGRKIDISGIGSSPLVEIVKNRRSCRSFSEQPLSFDQIGGLCFVAYNLNYHAVPSGGALYPLKIYVLIEKDQDGIPEGYYEYDPENDSLILFNQNVDKEQLKYCFNQETMPFGSSVQIIIAVDFSRQSHKYANRCYRLALIEAGQVAQNISLFCEESGLGSCELGGVLDEPLMQELDLLEEKIYPLLAIAVGYKSKSVPLDFNKMAFVEQFRKKGYVSNCYARTFGSDGSFFGGTAEYHDNGSDPQYSGSTSSSYADCVFKAVIEGYERWCSTQARIDYCGPATEIKNWLHPYSVIPLTKFQAKKAGLNFFTEDLPIDWTIGEKHNGDKIYIPSDLVFYGHLGTGRNIYYGNSSGVATFSNRNIAIKKALEELIERDAIMRSWYTKTPPNILGEKALPVHAIKRMMHWAKQHRTMYVLEMPSQYGYVYETIIIGNDFPAFVSGAAATISAKNIENVINKSIQEAEYSLLTNLQDIDQSKYQIAPEDVLTPSDHGRLYYSAEYANKLQWLWSGTTKDQICTKLSKYFAELVQELELIVVDVSPQNAELCTVRVISQKLVPINFGFYTAHYTHSELVGKINPDSLILPHYFS